MMCSVPCSDRLAWEPVKGWNGKKQLTLINSINRQRIVATGNLRTIVESEVEGWAYENKK